ncbi:MAG: pseudouridine synthase [Salibacteraceae bacterium]
MAKKSTWEKRAKKVKKEEHLVLGGNTNKKKQGVKKKYPPKGSDGGAKYVITRDGDANDDSKPRPKTNRDNRRSDTDGRGQSGSGKFKSNSAEFRKNKPFSKFRKDGPDTPFKGKDSAKKSFSRDDRKKSQSKFTNDKPFDGFEERGKSADDLIRLNKYLSMAGVCSRREADTFIEQGLVTVNGEVVTTLGTKVKPTDDVKYAGERVNAEKLRYVLLNKPKDCITTLSDERGRSTVMGLVKNACRERIYPVGRLDRNTTGLLLLTNDGDMAKKLSHPSHEIRKVYHVITDKNVSIADLKKLETGVELDDGIAKADAALFAGDGSVRNEIGLEIHSGRNRIVRRMFDAMGYEVIRLDRAAFAGLSKKGLPRGRWRFLTDKEVSYLKML